MLFLGWVTVISLTEGMSDCDLVLYCLTKEQCRLIKMTGKFLLGITLHSSHLLMECYSGYFPMSF